MSFGFSVSDFVTLGGLTLKLYDEFKKAPGACQAFANELQLFHRILNKVGLELEGNTGILEESDYADLKACANSCKELIYIRIYGAASVSSGIQAFENFGHDGILYANVKYLSQTDAKPDGFERIKAWRQRLAKRKFAAKIPELQRAVTAHIQSLIAFNALISRSDQLRVFACHDRTEALHVQTRAYLEDSQTSVIDSQTRLEAASERLGQSQAKMERQLQSVLASQQRRERPILSQSLDASSPEGRETWMNLGRLLRTEGITPAIIEQNRDALVKAMKTTLREAECSSTPQSYHTAIESFSSRHGTSTYPSSSGLSAQTSLSLLGSAPRSGALFPDELPERHNGVSLSLNHDANVRDGLQSLLQGMEAYPHGDEPGHVSEHDDIQSKRLDEAYKVEGPDNDNASYHVAGQRPQYKARNEHEYTFAFEREDITFKDRLRKEKEAARVGAGRKGEVRM